MLKAFERLDARDRAAYAAELERLADEFNRADDGSLVIPAEYLEVVMTNR